MLTGPTYRNRAGAQPARYRLHWAFVTEAAHSLAELNTIHPFREGNGRIQLIFMDVLAAQAGHPLELDRLQPVVFLTAMIKSFSGNEQPLAAQLFGLTAL